jgi:hypothetical protein
MAAHKGPASLSPRCTRSGSYIAAIPFYPPYEFIFWLMTPFWGWPIFWYFSTIGVSVFWVRWLIYLVILFVILCQVYYVWSSMESRTQVHGKLKFLSKFMKHVLKSTVIFCLLQLPPTHFSACFVPHIPGWVCSWQCVGSNSTRNHILPGRFSRMHTQDYCHGWCCQGYLQQIGGCGISVPYKQGSRWTMH